MAVYKTAEPASTTLYNEAIVRESEPSAPESKDEREPINYCPVCSTRLTARKCKLLCEKCGYYMSCADYY
jgi:hypothetical protein